MRDGLEARAPASNKPKRRKRERKTEIHFNLVFFHAIARALATLFARGFPEKVKGGEKGMHRETKERKRRVRKNAYANAARQRLLTALHGTIVPDTRETMSAREKEREGEKERCG